jgi:hypothetical protein
MGLKGTVMDEARLQAYINLIEFSTSVYSIRAGTMIFKSLIFEEGAFKN